MLNGEKILISDNNETDIKVIRLLLDKCNVISFNRTGTDILSLVRREAPDCILLGHNQDNNISYEILQRLKRDEQIGRKIPVIMLIEHDSVGFVQEITHLGACDYLVKGFYAKNTLIKTILLAIERQKLVNIVYEQQQELEKLATIDELTGLYNRRALIKSIDEHILFSRRYKLPLSLAVCDIDKFKSINDNYGHMVGDSILKAVADIFISRVRKTDISGRNGGDEFIILFPNINVKKAAKVVESIREKVMHVCQFSDKFKRLIILDLYTSDTYYTPLNVTLSFGVVELTSDVESSDELITKADTALYFAKQQGRNIVAFINEENEMESYTKLQGELGLF